MEKEVDADLKKALSYIINSGYQLDKDVLDFLQEQDNPLEFIKHLVNKLDISTKKELFISRDILETTLFLEEKNVLDNIHHNKRNSQQSIFSEIESDIQIIEDPTKEISSKGKIDDFIQYFNNRYSRMVKILRRRYDARDSIPINDVINMRKNSKVKIIGIISEKRERGEKIFFQIEDKESCITVLVTKSNDYNLYQKARTILHDEIICVQGTKVNENLVFANEIIFPDIPDRKPNKSYEHVYAALISDIHFGSKYFLNDAFDRFILFLNGKIGNKKQREISRKLKYLVICGDIVDGIGIYPNQEQELSTDDIYKQYLEASKYFSKISDKIEIIIIPGNHDATRQALPQPAILSKYAEPIFESRKVVSLGNPSRISLHGVEFLLYHGRSLDDIIGLIPNILYRNLEKSITKAMKHLLIARHLSPIYGQRTPIAPEPKDFMVIDKPPDILHAGHVHVFGHETYRGTLLINSGTWQAQTDFQKRVGLSPTPGVVPIVDLLNLTVSSFDFLNSKVFW